MRNQLTAAIAALTLSSCGASNSVGDTNSTNSNDAQSSNRSAEQINISQDNVAMPNDKRTPPEPPENVRTKPSPETPPRREPIPSPVSPPAEVDPVRNDVGDPTP